MAHGGEVGAGVEEVGDEAAAQVVGGEAGDGTTLAAGTWVVFYRPIIF